MEEEIKECSKSETIAKRKKCIIVCDTKSTQTLPSQNVSLFTLYVECYDHSADDHRLVTIFFVVFVVVYSLRTNTWKRVQDFPYSRLARDPGTLLNGAIHGSVSQRKDSSESLLIGAFEFRSVSPPLSVKNFHAVQVFGGCLCILPGTVLSMHNDFRVMKEYGKRESWTKIVISISYLHMKPLGFLKNREALFEIDGKLVLFNPREEVYRNLAIHGIPDRIEYQVETCVESLVSPNLKAMTIRRDA
ncbi:hypothetical protein POTOM_032302 [Populus tomentosa]|uniref:F-box associated domain-containing protein n=1 Tax=Populus tomentosa TaxID=118781 RepID=A0A8X7ZK49_POPTO|nr:hypothetical protein POTOM_032302 [Populus tomentosa]